MEPPKAEVPEPADIKDGWTKVPESADWTSDVKDVDKFADEEVTDPSRVAILAVIQVEDGDAWLEPRSLVASEESDGKPPQRDSMDR